MPDPASEKPSNPFTAPPQKIAVPRALFESVPGRRSVYIIAYAVFIALAYGPTAFAMAGHGLPDSFVVPLTLAIAAAYVVFAYQMIRAMYIMGYEWWLIIGTVSIGIMAIPGLILVAYIDRKIATTWDAANPAGSYRSAPPQK